MKYKSQQNLSSKTNTKKKKNSITIAWTILIYIYIYIYYGFNFIWILALGALSATSGGTSLFFSLEAPPTGKVVEAKTCSKL